MRRSIVASIIMLAAAWALAACSYTSSSSSSRHTLYDSIDALAADSSAIVTGVVVDQWREAGAWVSAVDVESSPVNPQLGANLDDDTPEVADGEVVEVRQTTDPLLEPGGEYALFLTPSMLDGSAASQYFITGAVAGLYVRDGDTFRRVVTDSGDTLPDTMTVVGRD